MATISFAGATETQITVNIGHNGSAVDNFSLSCDGSVFSTGSFVQTTSHSTQRTKTGLSPSTTHSFSVSYFRGSIFVDSASGSWSTDAPPPPPVPGPLTGLQVSVSGTAPNATVTATWSSASGATSYDWSAAGQSGGVTTTSKSITVTSAGSYSFSVTPRNNSGTGPGQSAGFTVSSPPNPVPGPISNGPALSRNTDTSIFASWGSASGATSYDWSLSGPTSSSGNTSSTNVTNGGLSPGNYTFTVAGRNSSGVGPSSSNTINIPTPPPVPSPITGLSVTVSGQAPNATMNASWSPSSGATDYAWTISGADFLNGNTPGTSVSQSLFWPGNYTFTVIPQNSAGMGSGDNRSFTVTGQSSPPIGTPSVTAQRGTFSSDVSWTDNVQHADSYDVYANDGTSGDVYKDTSFGFSATISLSREYWQYTIKVVPINTVGAGTPGTATTRTFDVTSPTTFIDDPNNAGYVKETEILLVQWPNDPVPANGAASDVGNTSRFWYKNGVFQGSIVAQNSWLFTGLLVDTEYTFGAEVMDAEFNISALATRVVRTTKNRPEDWEWFFTKTAGGDFNITDDEWNAFTDRINEFEVYKSVPPTAFPAYLTGQVFTAEIYNDAEWAIKQMSGRPYDPVSTGDDILATDINGIRGSLNII